MFTPQKVHYDKFLTEISVGYKNEEFIADKLLPSLPMVKQSDRYFVYNFDEFVSIEDERGDADIAGEISWSWSHDTYYSIDHALRHPIPDKTVANQDEFISLQQEAAEKVMKRLLLNKEKKAANFATDVTKYKADLNFDALTPWTDASSDPIGNIEDAKDLIHQKSGMEPNTLILSKPVYKVLRTHPKLLELFKNTETSIVPLDVMKKFFDVQNIIIAKALEASSDTQETKSYIWGDNAILAYVPSTPKPRDPAFGYSFEWKAYNGSAINSRVYRDEPRRVTYVESEYYYDFKIISDLVAAIFPDIV